MRKAAKSCGACRRAEGADVGYLKRILRVDEGSGAFAQVAEWKQGDVLPSGVQSRLELFWRKLEHKASRRIDAAGLSISPNVVVDVGALMRLA